MIIGLVLGVLLLIPVVVQAQTITRDTLNGFIAATNASSACILSQRGDRSSRNVLVWPRSGRLAALMYRADLAQTAPVAPPCWSGNGSCVLFEGPLAGAANLCETSPGLRETNVSSLSQRRDLEALAPDLEAIAAALMPLTENLTGGETWAALLEGHAVYMAEGERGARQVRIFGPGGAFTIARLRPSWETLDLTSLEAAMAAMGNRDLALVGPKGVLTTDGRLYIRGRCLRVADAEEVRSRLVVANAVFPLEEPPDATDEDATYDDIVQGLLGGTPSYGSPIAFVPEQDPLTLIYLPNQLDLCP